MNHKFCTKCGTPIPTGSKFCRTCGNSIPQVAAQTVSPQGAAIPKEDATPKRSSGLGILDFTKAGSYKKRIDELEALLTPEHQQALDISAHIKQLESQALKQRQDFDKMNVNIQNASQEIARLNAIINEKKKYVIELDNTITLQEFGMYTPMYEAMSSEKIKAKLLVCREQQKQMIKQGVAAVCETEWVVEGSKAKGKKMANDSIKQIIRSFNNECDAIIDKVKFNNYSAVADRISKSFQALNKMNQTNRISLRPEYLRLKLDELRLVHEYAMKKEQEKEEERQRREELREQKKLAQELQQAREKLEKEENHFAKALDELKTRLAHITDEVEKDKLVQKAAEIEQQLVKIKAQQADVDYRESNTRAGYVYVISNIGAFGPDVYKIGVTRRLDPHERVRELGDASVPFKFDVHCMVFSDDAPALETALHHHFDNAKLNQVNTRREFFRAPINEIEALIRKNYNDTFEITHTPEAEEYRISEKLLNKVIDRDQVVMSNEVVLDEDGEE